MNFFVGRSHGQSKLEKDDEESEDDHYGKLSHLDSRKTNKLEMTIIKHHFSHLTLYSNF